MVVGAVAVLPHRQHQRQIGLLLVLEPRGDRLEFIKRPVGVNVGVTLLELDRPFFARGLATLQRDVDELATPRHRRHIAKSAAAQDRGLECKLRRDADAHLLLSRHLPGLVIENGIAAVRELFDAVGAPAQA